jgi:hypothetical protein
MTVFSSSAAAALPFDRPAHFHYLALYVSVPLNRKFPTGITSGQAFLAMDRILDGAVAGPLSLRIPEIAKLVVAAIQYRDRISSVTNSTPTP